MAGKQTILITGGSGLIGSRLKEKWAAQGHEVRLLGRSHKGKGSEGKYYWDPSKGEMDGRALKDVTRLVHLAGETVGGKRWSEGQKKEIIDSRVESSRLLIDTIQKTGHKPQKVLAASAVGYYGAVTLDRIFTERDAQGHDFLARVCGLWEAETTRFDKELGIPTVVLRIGVVLAKEGGALQEIVKPMRFVMGVVLGSGRQWVPWIHIDDLAGIIHFSLDKKETRGVYNAVAPQHTNFRELVHAAAKSMHRPVSPVKVPSIILKAALGEQSQIVLEGTRVSSEKIEAEGYPFRFTDIQKALDDLLAKGDKP